MQQLNQNAFFNSLRIADDKVIIDLPLPATQLATQRFIEQLSHCTQSQLVSSEWGADRFQAMFEKHAQRYSLHIEWLCEAMWIECDHSNYPINDLINALIR